jgi:hypothetical protein
MIQQRQLKKCTIRLYSDDHALLKHNFPKMGVSCIIRQIVKVHAQRMREEQKTDTALENLYHDK